MATYKIFTTEVETSSDGKTTKIIRHNGLCIRSPDGSLWEIGITDEGVLATKVS